MGRQVFASWRRGAVMGAVLVAAMAVVGVRAGSAATSTTPSTTTSSPLTLVEWKDHYEPAIGEIADDVDLVVATGRKDAEHPTKKEARAIASACRTWHDDAETLPAEVPPIPMASAEKTWESLIAASLSGSSDCTAVLQRDSTSVVKDFHKELALVDADESRLVDELGTSAR